MNKEAEEKATMKETDRDSAEEQSITGNDEESQEESPDENSREKNPEEEIEEEDPEKRLSKELGEAKDKYLRLLAEFENYKRRTAQEMQTRFKFAGQALALDIIAGLDALDIAVKKAKEEEDDERLREFVKGLEMAQNQFYEAFRKNNIERIYPEGEEFDPNQHEAMLMLETDEVEPNRVAEVFQAGYLFHDRVIRPAMVQVAKKKSKLRVNGETFNAKK